MKPRILRKKEPHHRSYKAKQIKKQLRRDEKTNPLKGAPQGVTVIRRYAVPQAALADPREVEPIEQPPIGGPRFRRREKRNFEGQRIVTIRDGDRIQLRGRSSKSDFARRYPEIVADLQTIRAQRFIVVAELGFVAATAAEDLERFEVRLRVFDILFEGDVRVNESNLERRERLRRLVPEDLHYVEVVGLADLKGHEVEGQPLSEWLDLVLATV